MNKVKNLFKRMLKATATLALAALVFVSDCTNACAYNNKDYELNTGYITKRTGTESHVTLYMYANTDSRAVKYNPTSYLFYCIEGEFPSYENYAVIEFQFKPENKKVYDTLDHGEVWVWQFPIENGTYCFSWPRELDLEFLTLTPNLEELDMDTHGMNFFYNLFYTDTFVEDLAPYSYTVENDTIRVYCMYKGYQENYDFYDAGIEEFQEWAKANEEYYASIEAGMETEENKSESDTTNIVQVSPSEEAEKLETTPEPVVATPKPKPTELQLATAAPAEEEKKSTPVVPVAIAVGTGVAVFAGIGRIRLKRK